MSDIVNDLRLGLYVDPKDAADEIERNWAAIAELVAVLTEYISAADNSMCPADDDDVSAMLRFADADNNARALITKHQQPTTTEKGSN